MLNDVCNGSCSRSTTNENETAISECACEGKTLSPVSRLPKSYRGCRYYRPIKGAAIDKHPCILNDLCDQRQITDCPVRIAYCQNIGESDDDFASFLADRNLSPEENLNKFYAARGRVC